MQLTKISIRSPKRKSPLHAYSPIDFKLFSAVVRQSKRDRTVKRVDPSLHFPTQIHRPRKSGYGYGYGVDEFPHSAASEGAIFFSRAPTTARPVILALGCHRPKRRYPAPAPPFTHLFGMAPRPVVISKNASWTQEIAVTNEPS